MAQWRIRVVVPEVPDGRHLLRSALAQIPVTDVQFSSSDADIAETTGHIVVELVEDEALQDLLRVLHEISPQVLISRVGVPEPTADQAIRVRKLSIP